MAINSRQLDQVEQIENKGMPVYAISGAGCYLSAYTFTDKDTYVFTSKSLIKIDCTDSSKHLEQH